MNTKLIQLSFLAFLVSAPLFAQWGKRIQGNGNITTKTLNVGDYDEVSLVGSMDVSLERGNEGTITVTTDDNLHEYLEIEVKGDDLVLKLKKNTNFKSRHGIKITVPFEDLSEVSVTGSGDMVNKDVIQANDFEASVTGSGDLQLRIDSESFKAKVTGSGDLMVSGSTNTMDVKVTGSGDFKGVDLEANDANASVSGSGDIKLSVKNMLYARVNGSGDIEYKGSPTTSDTKVSGSGSIKSM